MTITAIWRATTSGGETYATSEDLRVMGADDNLHDIADLYTASPEDLAVWGVERCTLLNEPFDPRLYVPSYSPNGLDITFTGSALDFYTAQSNVLNFIADKSNAAQAEIDALAPFTSDGIAVTDDEGYTDAFAAVLAETDTYLAGLI